MQGRWQERAIASQVKQKLLDEDVRKMLLNESSESAAWLNRTLTAMWPHLDRMLSAAVRSFLIRSFVAFNQPDANGKSKSVKLDVTYVSFGSVPIKIDGVTAKPASMQIYSTRLDLDFSYRGDMSVELEASLPLGMKVPVALKDLEIIGKLKVEIAFKDKGALKFLSMCFMTPPTLNFSIKTLGKFDIMDLPTLKETINSILVAQIRQSMTYPKTLNFDWSGAAPASSEVQSMSDEEKASMHLSKMTHQTVSLLDDDKAASKNAENESQISTPRSDSSGDKGTLNDTPRSTSSLDVKTSPSKDSDGLSEANKKPRGSLGATDDRASLSSSQNHPLSHSNVNPSTSRGTGSLPPGNPSPSKNSTSSTAPSSSSATSSAPSSASSSKPMQSFAKQKEDLNEFLLMSPEDSRGILSVRVVECSNLRTSDLFSVSPYVNLELNGISFQTTVVKRTSAPAWSNALFEFPIPRYLPAKGLALKVRVLDKNKVGSDESLGYTSINIDRFMKQPDELIFLNEPLVNASSGRIHLQIKYMSE